ncbi:hypothetical protein EVAR_89838_1 [Eumeta japonica]|uniref:Uncharacterized protein n=1 Tax=Eumeta variegata TaxID=151549 RepID=A0A4C1SI31_EUMVA|nr:hypothetical protein EVAR_89838_1 [Eumeta japonica]
MSSPTTPTARTPAQMQPAKARRRLGRDDRTGCRGLEVPPPVMPSTMRVPAPVCLLFDKTGMRRYAVKDRTKILTEHVEEQLIPYPESDSREATSHQKQVEHHVQELLVAPVLLILGDYYVSSPETAKAIFRLPKQKVSGLNGIPTTAIKQLPRRAMVAMTRLFNGILWTGRFPGC